MAATKKTTERSTSTAKSYDGFTEDERAAMKERGQELKKAARRGSGTAGKDGESDVLAKISEMDGPDREMAERIHAIVTEAVPSLAPKTYYGMPAYARDGKDGKVICFFKPKSKFKVRYSTFGFQPDASLDEGEMWPTEFAVIELTKAAEARIADLVKKAAG